MQERTPLIFDPREIPPTSDLVMALEHANTLEEFEKSLAAKDFVSETGFEADDLINTLDMLSGLRPFEPLILLTFDKYHQAYAKNVKPKMTEEQVLEHMAEHIAFEGPYLGLLWDPQAGDFSIKFNALSRQNTTPTFDLRGVMVFGTFADKDEARKMIDYLANNTELVQQTDNDPDRYMVSPKVREYVNKFFSDVE